MSVDWKDAGAGGLLAVGLQALAWLVGRSDLVKEKQERRIREIAERAITDAKVDVRLSTIETVLPRIEQGVQDTKESVRDLADKFDRFLLKD